MEVGEVSANITVSPIGTLKHKIVITLTKMENTKRWFRFAKGNESSVVDGFKLKDLGRESGNYITNR